MQAKGEAMKREFTLLSGDVVEYDEPSESVAEFLRRVRIAAGDFEVTTDDMIDLIYGVENPLLKHGVLPGRGLVTREVYENPIFHIMQDLLIQKRIQRGEYDPEVAKTQYNMTVSEAATKLGVSPSAIRQAIRSKALDAIKVRGRWLLYPGSVDVYQVSNRGPNPLRPLSIAIGNQEGISARIKLPTRVEWEKGQGGVKTGVLERWRSVGLIIGGTALSEDPAQKRYVFWEIAPDDVDNVIEEGLYGVRGPFQVIRKIDGVRKAAEAFSSFEPR